MRKLIAGAVAVAVAVVGLSASAEAAQKQRVLVDRFTDTYADSVDCSAYGPHAFDNEFSGREKITVTDVLDAEGELLQTVFHAVIQETQRNSVSGGTLPLKGAVHEVWDYASNTRTLAGKVWLGTAPGGGTYVQDTGLITMTMDTDEPLFVAGPHEAFFDDLDNLVCDALAGV